MPRRKPGFYSTIEYIGPRPTKQPKRQFKLGGWVILLMAVVLGFYFGRPLLAPLRAEQASVQQAEAISATLSESPEIGQRIAAAALRRTLEDITYDPAYYKIDPVMGDIPPGKGGPADLVIRSLRTVGIDLQVELHEDIRDNFRHYPQLWNAMGPDSNIDHRRIPNLQRFFERNGEVLGTSRDASQYRPGDIVVWSLSNAEKHIGIVVPGPGKDMSEPWVVHNIGAGVKWENILFEYQIEGHFRYPTK
ncbi:MAG: DUF1287 domain-containing protein [Akkermansiaceae bacterium]|nr:DUF1287 domain-containing protein [Akkermansiaceae bacterium]